jgi:hypothetical protein
MVHDSRPSDLWWHDATMPTCIIENYVYYIRECKRDYSKDELVELMGKIDVQLKKNREVLREVYLEMRRHEDYKP